MMQAHVKAGAFTRIIAADDLSYPLTPPVEAARLGLYALVRLNDFDALAATVLDAPGSRSRRGGRSRTRCSGPANARRRRRS